ncbi:MAG TPA: YggS family pyridoxal phosphate-dependent enzyme [Candidatus Baltobacteraceae bacterium]|nr:YggS family pyridoxal phosphate-dependent enzyme [Candidatus Baltobacteraceae bacterium]
MADTISTRLHEVRERIAAAARRSGRRAEEVTLVVVSKTMSVSVVAEAIAAGANVLGENRVQEAHQKVTALAGQAVWHLIGHLQSNKAKLAVELFSRIHSVDSIRLAGELERHAAAAGKTVRCLLEVNVGDEVQKSGAAQAEVRRILEAVGRCPHLFVDGLMAIPPFLPEAEAVRPYFRRLREIRDGLERDGFSLPELSMGMSHDFEVAIEEGATLVRIGTAIFGPRG